MIDHDADAIIAAWHALRLHDAHSSFYSDTTFIEWIADDSRKEFEDTDGDQVADATLQLAQMVQAKVISSRSNLTRIHSAPEYQPPLVAGSPQQVASLAAKFGAAPFLELGVAAGIGRELWEEECANWVKLPREAGNGSYVALKVSGDSMNPVLHSGDVVMVKLDPSASPGDIVVARLDDGSFVVKRVKRIDSQVIELSSINPEYHSISVPLAGNPVVGVVLVCWCEH